MRSHPLWLSEPFVHVQYQKVWLNELPAQYLSLIPPKAKNKPARFNTILLHYIKVRACSGKCKMRLQVCFSVFIARECYCYCYCSILFLAS